MRVLGLSFGFHDSAAALISEGRLIAACQQERFSRIKNDASYPADAIEYCLKIANLKPGDIDLIAYHEEPLLKFDRIVRNWEHEGSEANGEFKSTVGRWLRDSRFDVRQLIVERLGVAPSRIKYCRHHDSHAASAYFCSPFERATIVTLDGVGEYETTTIGIGEHGKIRRLAQVELPHSLGLFYSAFTAFLGFRINEGEYKVMGMAAFGKPRYHDILRELIQLHPDGTFEIDQEMFRFGGASNVPYSQAMIDRLGPPRQPDTPFGISEASLPSNLSQGFKAETVAVSQHYADLAASVQACTEDVIRHTVRSAVDTTGVEKVAMAGGVALNSLANGRLLREDGLDLFIQPAAGDAGCALGAALFHWHHSLGGNRLEPMRSCALGRRSDRAEARRCAKASGFEIVHDEEDEDAYIGVVARLLSEGRVVGWVNGRAEWGPRALGHRSILADPSRADMQRIVNEKVKFREPFRPFAPAVPIERANEFFELSRSGRDREIYSGAPESFMLAVHPVRDAYKDKLPAVTHADGTARVQTVHRTDHPVFYKLLQIFGDLSGIPVLLNTSFNLNGEPIVDTHQDAVRTFTLSEIDYLCIDGIILSKRLSVDL
jgi:carbamoyltransferase